MSKTTQEIRKAQAKNRGTLGGYARAKKLSPEQRSESARLAVTARWARISPEERTAISRERMLSLSPDKLAGVMRAMAAARTRNAQLRRKRNQQ